MEPRRFRAVRVFLSRVGAAALLWLAGLQCAEESDSETDEVSDTGSEQPPSDGEPDTEETGQIELTHATPLLDEHGDLAAIGWARRALIQYNPEAIQDEHHSRIKQWEHYTIMSPSFTFSLTMADISFLTFVGVDLIVYETEQTLTGFDYGPPNGGHISFTTSPYGETTWNHGDNLVTVTFQERQRIIDVTLPATQENPAFSGQVVLRDDPEHESIAVSTPFSGPWQFFYENKIFGMPASGELQVGDATYRLEPGVSYGILDWGRGVWPEQSEWYWGQAAGTIGDREVAFNIGYGYGDGRRGTPDSILVDGVLHKLDAFEWQYDPEDLMAPWTLKSADGRFDMVLTPIFHQTSGIDLGLRYMRVDKMHGSFSGSMTLDDGTRLEVVDFLGFCEHSTQNW